MNGQLVTQPERFTQERTIVDAESTSVESGLDQLTAAAPVTDHACDLTGYNGAAFKICILQEANEALHRNQIAF